MKLTRDISLLLFSCQANALRQRNANNQYFQFPDLPEDSVRMQIDEDMKMNEDASHMKTQSLASMASTDEEKAFIKPFVDLDNQTKLFETMEGGQQDQKQKEQESVQEKARKESAAELTQNINADVKKAAEEKKGNEISRQVIQKMMQQKK